jgi:hypothetical protein
LDDALVERALEAGRGGVVVVTLLRIDTRSVLACGRVVGYYRSGGVGGRGWVGGWLVRV